jgi:glycosyltransferase involved in cell wall biosynthesis
MYDRNVDLDARYTAKQSFAGLGGNKLAFAFEALKRALNTDKLILSHINLLLFAKLIKFIRPSVNVILWAHGIEVWRDIPSWKINFLKKHAEIWAVSNFTKQVLMDKHGLNTDSIKVLNNALDPYFKTPDQFQKPNYLLSRYGLKEDAFVLFTLTRLADTEHLKNYDLVVACIAKLKAKYPNLVYFIGGKADDEEKDRLKSLIDAEGVLQQVKLLGFIDEQELPDHFLLADCFVLPSKKEGFGIVLIEAAATGCQVIGGNKDGSVDALLNGGLGQTIDPDSLNDILTTIERAIANTLHERSKQQQITLEHFSFESYTKKVHELLN